MIFLDVIKGFGRDLFSNVKVDSYYYCCRDPGNCPLLVLRILISCVCLHADELLAGGEALLAGALFMAYNKMLLLVQLSAAGTGRVVSILPELRRMIAPQFIK